jgi:hypothetical protein
MKPSDIIRIRVQVRVDALGINPYPASLTIVSAYRTSAPTPNEMFAWVEILEGQIKIDEWLNFMRGFLGASNYRIPEGTPETCDLNEVAEELFEGIKLLEFQGRKLREATPPYQPVMEPVPPLKPVAVLHPPKDQQELVELLFLALHDLERYLRETIHHNAIQAAHARRVMEVTRPMIQFKET